MPKLMPYPFASALALGAWPFVGLRLRTLRQFQAFLASGALAVRVSSYCFWSASPLPLRCALASAARVCKAGASFSPLGLTHRCSGSGSPPTNLSRWASL